MEKVYTIDETKMKDLISQVSTIRVLIEELAPEDIFDRNVTTKWAELINEAQDLEDVLEEIKNPPEDDEPIEEVDGKVAQWIRDTTPIPKFN